MEKQPFKPKGVISSFKINPILKELVEEYAGKEGINYSEYVKKAVFQRFNAQMKALGQTEVDRITAKIKEMTSRLEQGLPLKGEVPESNNTSSQDSILSGLI